jgi:hypothetical protein
MYPSLGSELYWKIAFEYRKIKTSFFSTSYPRITAAEFSSDNLQHISQLKQMGIQIQPLPGGRKYYKLRSVTLNNSSSIQKCN